MVDEKAREILYLHACQPAVTLQGHTNSAKKNLKINENLETKKGLRYDGKMPRYLGIDYLTDVSFPVFLPAEKLGYKKFTDLATFARP